MNTESLVGKLVRKSYQMEGSLTFKLGEEELEPGMRSRIVLRPKPNRGTNEEKKRETECKNWKRRRNDLQKWGNKIIRDPKKKRSIIFWLKKVFFYLAAEVFSECWCRLQ
ncbi:unnamed protein product [Prunus brigantina]